jgi:hypothetical protein
VVLVLALLGVVAVIVGVAVSRDDGDTADKADDTGTTEPDASSTTSTPETTEDTQEPSDPNAFVDEDGGYEITMPDTWAFTSLHDDIDTAGERMFPDDANKAAAIQASVGALPRIINFYGVVADEVGTKPFVTNVNINVTDAPGGSDLEYEELASQVRQGIEMVGAEAASDEPFTIAGHEGVKIEFNYPEALDASGVQYSVIVDDRLWVVNFASGDTPGHADEFDTMAESFRVTE